MTSDADLTLRNRIARLLERASAARATGQNDVADRFTERAAELLDRVVSEELAVERRLKKNPDPAGPGQSFDGRVSRRVNAAANGPKGPMAAKTEPPQIRAGARPARIRGGRLPRSSGPSSRSVSPR